MSNPYQSIVKAVRLALLVLSMPLAGTAVAAEVRLDANCAAQLGAAQQRLYKSTADIHTLRNYIFIRGGSAVDVIEAHAWAERINTARARCLSERALLEEAAPAAQRRG